MGMHQNSKRFYLIRVFFFKNFIFILAPELFKRDPSQIATEKTDVYAFGLVCFEMTIHDFPWKNHTVAHVIVSVLAGEIVQILFDLIAHFVCLYFRKQEKERKFQRKHQKSFRN